MIATSRASSATLARMNSKTLFLVSFLFYAACATKRTPAIEWCHKNINGIESIDPERRVPIYYVTSIFLKRLTDWQSYQPFYDKLYSQNLEFTRHHPYFIDVQSGLYLTILRSNEKLTDLAPYRSLKGKTVEDLLPDRKGDKRSYDSMPGEGARQTLIIAESDLTKLPKGTFNTYYHEFGHLLHLSLLTEAEFQRNEKLYASAKKNKRFFDDYAALTSSEYFATGLEAYLSETKQGTEGNYRKHSKQDLEKLDPELKIFIDDLVKNSFSPVHPN